MSQAKAKPVISVIIPTKDRFRFLQKAIPMYLKYPIVGEIIIIIDGSQDGTLEYLKKMGKQNGRIKYIDNGVNKGIPYSRNKGIDAAKYEYIFSTEDDLEITGNFFNTLLLHMDKAGASLISARNIFRYEDESSEEALRRTDQLKGDPINRRTIDIDTSLGIKADHRQLLIASPMLAKTDVFRKIRFDEIYKVNFWREETDFQISAQEAGYKIISCPHAICFNFIIKNDRSGVHSAIGIRRAKWITINNWKFINKHEEFIRENFSIGNKYIYITKFALRRFSNEMFISSIQPALSRIKHYLT